MGQIARKNHYIPQFYLKQWANSEQKVWEYKLLVSHVNVPLWGLVSIKESTAYHNNLYTGVINDLETDEIENWFNYEIEYPAQKVLEKIDCKEKLNNIELEKLIRFVAAQYLRTPAAYFRAKLQFEKTANETVSEVIKSFSERNVENDVRKVASTIQQPYSKWLPMKAILRDCSTSDEMKEVWFQTGFTRSTWYFQILHILDSTYKQLLDHDWKIVEAATGVNLYTSDDPAIFFNYNDSNDYDFKGGWAKKHGNAFFPLSPRHFLFTEMGVDLTNYTIDKNPLLTFMMQRFTIENAFRSIYSVNPNSIIYNCRQRKTDENQYNKEKEIWKDWNSLQIKMDKLIKE